MQKCHANNNTPAMCVFITDYLPNGFQHINTLPNTFFLYLLLYPTRELKIGLIYVKHNLLFDHFFWVIRLPRVLLRGKQEGLV